LVYIKFKNIANLQKKVSKITLKSKILVKSTNQNKKFLQKTVFHTLKVEKSQKYTPMEFAGSTQNPKKNIGTSNQLIKTENFPKKKYD
jgi:hypothetical protein